MRESENSTAGRWPPAEEVFIVGDDGRAEAVERRKRLENAGLIGEVIEVLLLVAPHGVVAAVAIGEEVHDALERSIHRARAGVVAPVAQAVNVLRDMTLHRGPIARSRRDAQREAPRAPAFIFDSAPPSNGVNNTGFTRSAVEGEHQSETRIFQRRQPEAALIRIDNDCGAALPGRDQHTRQLQIGFRQNKITPEFRSSTALLRHGRHLLSRDCRHDESDREKCSTPRNERETDLGIGIALRQPQVRA